MNAISPAPSTKGGAALATQAPPIADSLLNFVARAMADPAVDVAKLEGLLRIQREIVATEARVQFNRAMTAAQAEMLPVVRDATNDATRSRYARLETIDAAIRPIYTRHGFHPSYNTETPIDAPGNVRVCCRVAHAAGHQEHYQLEAAPDVMGAKGNANKTVLHGIGSTISYLRRYLLTMAFNIVLTNEDSDAQRPRAPAAAGGIDMTEMYRLLAACARDPHAVEANEAAFLRSMGITAVTSLHDVAPGELPRLRNALRTKLSVRAQRATQQGASA